MELLPPGVVLVSQWRRVGTGPLPPADEVNRRDLRRVRRTRGARHITHIRAVVGCSLRRRRNALLARHAPASQPAAEPAIRRRTFPRRPGRVSRLRGGQLGDDRPRWCGGPAWTPTRLTSPIRRTSRGSRPSSGRAAAALATAEPPRSCAAIWSMTCQRWPHRRQLARPWWSSTRRCSIRCRRRGGRRLPPWCARCRALDRERGTGRLDLRPAAGAAGWGAPQMYLRWRGHRSPGPARTGGR